MKRESWILALAVLVVAAGSWHPARSAEFRCSNGALERRIELSGPDATPGAACEVRYWRDATAPDSGRVLWRAQQDAEFCATKARELVTRLEAGGWTCAPGEQPASPEPMDTQAAEPPPVADAPAQTAPVPPPPDALRAVGPAEPSPPARAPAEASVPRAPIAPPSANPAAPLLDQVLRETLHSVEQLYGGEFQAEHAAFGDLDDDGVQDAVVLITYEAARNDYVQYLVAYLFNGETFRSVATRNVGGRFLDAERAALRGIAQNRILVELEALDGNAVCCETHRTAFVLDRGQLVEMPDAGTPDSERTSQAGPPSPD
jgi:hypothetical protein